MKVDDRALGGLAESVADGAAVDWTSVEGAAEPGSRQLRLVRHLRLVDSIAALHRSIPAYESDAPSSPGEADPQGKRWGRLVLLESIGKGTSCEVYRAWDSELHRDVALKLLDDDGAGIQDAHERVLGEGRRLARLRHANVVQVYGAEQQDGRVGLWMELVRGASLEALVDERGPFGAREAALIGLDVCSALAAVHGAGLLHRDVKAQNVMREEGGRTVLMDFGTGEELAGSSRIIGTPLYLAPEIFHGQKASVQSDVYSVGVLLFYLVSGRFPVTAKTMQGLAQAHGNRERQPLRDLRPDLPEAFVRVVERALDSDPSRRQRSAGDLESGLRESLEVRTREAAPAARVETPKITRPLTAGLVALALVVVALIVWTRLPRPAVVPPTNRLAVLPFRTVSAGAGAPAFAEEMTDQLISTLGQIRSLQVTSLSSVLPFADRHASMQEIGRLLNVEHLVEATVTVDDADNGVKRVRINARLIAAGTDGTIWSQSFERSLGDTLVLQAEVARAIANGIQTTLTPAEQRRLQQTRPSTPEATQAYFQGLHSLSQSSSNGVPAVEAFTRAIQLDPNHAGAHAGLARGYITLGSLGLITHPEARAKALAETQKAIELDPDSAEGYAVRADLQFYYDWDWAGADESYRRAIALNASFARARSQYARYLAAARRGPESIAEAARAADLDPMSASAASTKALMLFYDRDYEGALTAIQHALQLEPGAASAYFVLSRIQASRNDIDAAIAANQRALEITGPSAASSWKAHLIRLKALSGATEPARTALRRLPADLAAQNQSIGQGPLAYVYEALGDHASALTFLEKGINEREPDLLWLAVDPRADSLRADPRFDQLLTRIGVPR